MQTKIDIALQRLDEAVQTLKPIAVFGLYSGGHDSFSATYVASLHQAFTAAVHINTGIGIEATRTHVRETCAEWKWPLLEYKATENTRADGTPDPMDYEAMVKAHGFPGPGKHSVMYVKLKDRQLARLERDFGASARGRAKRRVLYVTGVRSQESVRRMGTVELCKIEKRRIWLAPIHDWTKLDTTDLITHVGAKRNPIVDLIHKSGECLCGAFAKKGELEELAMWPETRPAYERIKKLEMEIAARFPWGWEGRPPRERKYTPKLGPLCHNCSIGGAA